MSYPYYWVYLPWSYSSWSAQISLRIRWLFLGVSVY
ncbi:unnamed protein product [Brassica rapa subsp. narinosa]